MPLRDVHIRPSGILACMRYSPPIAVLILLSGSCRPAPPQSAAAAPSPPAQAPSASAPPRTPLQLSAVVWSRPITVLDQPVEAGEVRACADGSFYVSGSVSVPGDPPPVEGAEPLPRLFLARFDAQGNQQWAKTFPPSFWAKRSFGLKLETLPDGAVLAAGVASAFGTPTDTSVPGVALVSASEGGYLIKVAPDGQLLWQRERPAHGVGGLRARPDGSFVLTHDQESSPDAPRMTWDTYVTPYRPDGTDPNSTLETERGLRVSTTPAVFADGSFATVGAAVLDSKPSTPTTRVTRYRPNGTALWTRDVVGSTRITLGENDGVVMAAFQSELHLFMRCHGRVEVGRAQGAPERLEGELSREKESHDLCHVAYGPRGDVLLAHRQRDLGYIGLVDAAVTCSDQLWVVGYRLEDENMPAVVWRFAPNGSPLGSPRGETLGDIESTTAFDATAPCAGLVLGTDPGAQSGTFHVAKVTVQNQPGDRR